MLRRLVCRQKVTTDQIETQFICNRSVMGKQFAVKTNKIKKTAEKKRQLTTMGLVTTNFCADLDYFK